VPVECGAVRFLHFRDGHASVLLRPTYRAVDPLFLIILLSALTILFAF